MFTGLIEAVGDIQTTDHTASGSTLTVAVDSAFLKDAKLGDSIAIDGVCTTATNLTDTTFTFQASPETLRKTAMAAYAPGRRVNLELPLLPTQRLGGHFVTGHVDGTATLAGKQPEGNSVILTFAWNQPELAPFFVPKGSVAVHGSSLTVNEVTDKAFTVAIIPHTLTHTNLGDVAVGDTVNIETDLLGKYMLRFAQTGVLNQLSAADALELSHQLEAEILA
ncbi:MAG: riboflavin synthase [Vampirovibrio sp.]|nr:riboflavin synthase [Vampirovibrio sp.]